MSVALYDRWISDGTSGTLEGIWMGHWERCLGNDM